MFHPYERFCTLALLLGVFFTVYGILLLHANLFIAGVVLLWLGSKATIELLDNLHEEGRAGGNHVDS